MLPLITSEQIIKGDPKNLEGKAIVFSYYPASPAQRERYGSDTIMHFITNSVDFIEKLGITIEASGYPASLSYDIMLLFYCTTPPIPPIDLILGSEDVIHAGFHDNQIKGEAAVEVTHHLYLQAFLHQWHTKPLPTHQDIKPGSLEQYIMSNFLQPMFGARRANSHTGFSAVQRSFLRFSDGSDFDLDAHNLCALYAGEVWDSHLTKAYVEKICAIHAADYEKAAQARDRVDILRSYVLSDPQRGNSSLAELFLETLD